ncbi:MAG: ATP synthase gamma chain [Parcubacteria group bacterium GW2011_GWA2_51_12]|nr:MAG: ATP synthase gamma chain [Parcubacteria group bacterium GW2011_GWA2_51_12]
MPSTKDLRRRIKSVRSTRQITKAMELVAAAKMRKTQIQALATRTYTRLVREMIKSLRGKADFRLHRLLKSPGEVRSIAVILLTSNRGLIGGFNNNLVSTALNYVKSEQGKSIEFITIGKKGTNAVHKRGFTLAAEFEKRDAASGASDILPLARLVTDDFVGGRYDRVVLVYMEFLSTLRQETRVLELLPLSEKVEQGAMWEDEPQQLETTDFLFEPSADLVLEKLLPRVVEINLYQALLETNASEHSARMVAMKNASDAASDLIRDLTLDYNQIRQAGITKEISEIVAGQLALKD